MGARPVPRPPRGHGGAPTAALSPLRLGILAQALLVPLLFAKQGRDLKLLAGGGIALLALPAVVQVLSARGWRLLPAAALPAAAWLAVSALGTLGSRDGVDELARQAIYMLTFIGAAVAAQRGDLRRLCTLWLLTFILVGGYALVQKLGLDPVEEFRKWHSADRVFSTFGNPDFLGAHLAFLFPLGVGLATGAARPASGRLAGGAAAAVALVLFWTGSRGAWLGALAGLVTWIAFGTSRHERREALTAWRAYATAGWPLLILAVAGCSFLLLPSIWNTLTRHTDRLDLWEGTCRMIRTAPLTGWGVSRFAPEYAPFAPASFAARMKADNTFAEHPHSEYLHVAVEGGVLGLGIFLWLLTAVVAVAVARARHGDRLDAGALGALVAILVHVTVDRNFRLASTGIPFWLLAGLQSTRPRQTAPSSGFPALLAVLPALGLSAWLLRPLLASYRVAGDTDFLKQAAEFTSAQLEEQRPGKNRDPQFLMALGNSYAKEGKFPRAVEAFSEALRLDPRHAAAANNLGNSWFMMSRFDEAIAAYTKVLALDPGNRDARFNRAFALFHQRKIKEALVECDALLKVDPQNSKALQLRAQLSP